MSVDQAVEPAQILVVDDQEGIRVTLQAILNKKGYRVEVAEDGARALEMAGRIKFRLILMDVKMPGMSGVEAFLRIKEVSSHTSVIMMTAYAAQDEIRRAIREGAYCVVHKPFEMAKVLTIIAECLENRTIVLIVDDECGYRVRLQEFLEKREYRVIAVESREECLRRVAERRFQVIVMEVKSPGLDGVETLRQIQGVQPGVAVIVITNSELERIVDASMQEGAFACLRKPLEIEACLDIIDRCLKTERRGGGADGR